MRTLTRLIVTLSLGLIAGTGLARAADKVFIGYVYSMPERLDYGLYTHLCHAFVVADGEGVILEGRGGSAPSRALTTAAHAKGVRVLLSLGGWGWDKQFAAIVSKPESEDRYVAAVLKMVDAFDYDGIDLDWEYPDTKEEIPGFERLVRRLRVGIDEIGTRKDRRMELTMAVSANPGTIRWLRPEFVVEVFDWLNVMTYDMAGTWADYAGHNAPLFASSRAPGGVSPSVAASILFALEEQKIPAERLTLGIPLYGRGFAVGAPYASTRSAPKSQWEYVDYNKLRAFIDAKEWTRERDGETKAPWLIAKDQSAVIGYDDEESVALKARWAREKNLRGVFFWEVAGDRLPDGSFPLQKSARGALFE